MTGTWRKSSAWRKSGAAILRCQRHSAPSEVRMPRPSVGAKMRCSMGVLGKRSASCSRMRSISRGALTQTTKARPRPNATSGSS
jgi:hypothetical protein